MEAKGFLQNYNNKVEEEFFSNSVPEYIRSNAGKPLKSRPYSPRRSEKS